MNETIKTQVVVLGSGPGGYSAAFRCADLGLSTIIVERYSNLGGVCLNIGCIPSKSLLHVSKIITEVNLLRDKNILFGNLHSNVDQIRIWKEKIVSELTSNISKMAKERNIKVINGYGKFTNTNTIQVTNNNYFTNIIFDNAIIAAGSSPITLPCIPYQDKRIWNSTNALALTSVPKRMLVIGGGIIGLEIATIYHALGSDIDVIEMTDQIIPNADKDIIKVFMKHISKKMTLMLSTKLTNIETKDNGIYVSITNKENETQIKCYDILLVAIGRIPNSTLLDAQKIGIQINNKGFIQVDKQMRTNISNIYAIGDIVSQPMLAHKAIYEAYVAAEVIANQTSYFNPKVIPSIIYTEPEVAWVGITEKEAKTKKISYEASIFPWLALGRAHASNCKDGITKLIFDKNTNKIIGGAIVGMNGGELIGEISLAIEMGCDVEDIALTIHAHPTLSESISLSAKIYDGTIIDLPNTKMKLKNFI
ncbi:dihydrolipoyl dehydrogenase [Candidatus Palibaumannia cicadellinicola]|uniref:Dihydrolipoyl dehydrogenase n=1 Tax=Candidatus Palibaumannia cicadellinicola TaxID=186490 RepID=A0A0K2BLX7_9GAMM|nr:dihydrolipoyl dehydrogenase [Candidatus Baumannia cicadellinicola]AKZ66038.1 Dihydrolipoamide dehydrogenase of pyruvate dehydrogenase complex [Candidatus Baumannia cicadellinicola]